MLLAAITDEISMDLARALDVMKEYDCKAAELRCVWDKNLVDMDQSEIDQVRKILDDKQMPVCCLATPLFKCELGDSSGELGRTHGAQNRSLMEQMELLKKCESLAAVFDTHFIRIFAFWRRGELTPEIEDRIADSIADAVKYAEDKGLVLLMENEHDCYLGTGSDTARFLARFESPALRSVWDPGNAFCANEKPFPDGYEAIRNYAVHIHVKDAELLASGRRRFVVVGEGEVNYKEHFAALKADNYQGYISLETHYRPYGGTSEQASRLCLQSMNKLLAES